MKHQTEGKESEHETSDPSKPKRMELIGNLEWSFWSNSALAVLGLLAAGLLITPIFDFMSQNTKIYCIAAGVCIGFCTAVMFFAHSIILHREGRSSTQLEEQDQTEKATLKEKINRLESDLSKVKSEVQDVRQRQEPRSLSSAQRNDIINSISSFPKTKAIVCSLQDPECRQYAQDIFETLNAAGWDTLFGAGTIYSNFLVDFDNVQVSIAKGLEDNLPTGITALRRVLDSLGIARDGGYLTLSDASSTMGPGMEDRIVIRIAGKPRRKPID